MKLLNDNFIIPALFDELLGKRIEDHFKIKNPFFYEPNADNIYLLADMFHINIEHESLNNQIALLKEPILKKSKDRYISRIVRISRHIMGNRITNPC